MTLPMGRHDWQLRNSRYPFGFDLASFATDQQKVKIFSNSTERCASRPELRFVKLSSGYKMTQALYLVSRKDMLLLNFDNNYDANSSGLQ